MIEMFILYVGGRLIWLNLDGFVIYILFYLIEFLKNNFLILWEGEKVIFEKFLFIC